MRFCSNWQIYADDVTIRSGRWLGGVYYTDSEKAARLRRAQSKEEASRPVLEEAFKALGFNPEPLGQEAVKSRPKTKGERAANGQGKEASSFPSPYAHLSGSVRARTQCCEPRAPPVACAFTSVASLVHLCWCIAGASQLCTSTASFAMLRAVGGLCGPRTSPQRPAGRPSGGCGGGFLPHFERGVPYQDGKSAWQVLPLRDYIFLKKTHGWRLDKWSREQCISWSATLLLRHASYMTRDGHEQRSRLGEDGGMTVEDFCQYEMNQVMGVTRADVERLLDNQKFVEKRRFVGKYDGNQRLRRIAAAQGHGPKASVQFNEDELLEPARLDDGQLQPIMLHGTKRCYADKIRREGLKAGGDRGPGFRTHIHLVSRVETGGEIDDRAGVRGGSDTIVKVDIEKYIRAGGKCHCRNGD